MNIVSDAILEHALTTDFIQAGEGNDFADGWVHVKTVPYAIVAQPLSGSYGVDCGGTVGEAKAGEVFIVGANKRLAITHHGDRRRGKMASRWLHARWLVYGSVDAVGMLTMPLIVRGSIAREFGLIMDALLELKKADPSLGVLATRQSLGFRALGILCEISEPRGFDPRRLGSIMAVLPALKHIDGHYREPMDLDGLARRACMSRSRFFQRFKLATGLTPAEHLRVVRLSAAQKELLATDLPIYAIAEHAGYANQFHFSRDFRRRLGMCPVEYRKMGHAVLV